VSTADRYACVDIGDHHVGYACIGMDPPAPGPGQVGRLIVWGMGWTEDEARADAQDYLDRFAANTDTRRLNAHATEFCVKPISARERDVIQRGDVRWPPAGRE